MKKAYLDSSACINSVEGILAHRIKARNELDFLEANGWSFCISDLVVLETLIKPNRENRLDLINKYKIFFSSAIKLASFESIFQNALIYSKLDCLKAFDATHVSLAVEYQCGLFVTTDQDYRNLKSLPLHFIDLSKAVVP